MARAHRWYGDSEENSGSSAFPMLSVSVRCRDTPSAVLAAFCCLTCGAPGSQRKADHHEGSDHHQFDPISCHRPAPHLGLLGRIDPKLSNIGCSRVEEWVHAYRCSAEDVKITVMQDQESPKPSGKWTLQIALDA